VISTILAYAALALSGSRGLAQLGCFSAVGLFGAFCATRTLVPGLLDRILPDDRYQDETSEIRPGYRHGAWFVVLTVGIVFVAISQKSIWTNDLASLTPISSEKLQRDTALRSRLGAPDIRTLLAISGDSAEQALRRTESIKPALNDAVREGALNHFQLVTDILPSQATQLARRDRLSEGGDLEARIGEAMKGTPLRSDAFDPFVADVRSLLTSDALLTVESFKGSVLEALVSNALYFDGERWTSLVMLRGLDDSLHLENVLNRQAPGVVLVDLKEASKSLVERYRLRVLGVLGLAFCAISLFLIFQIGFNARLLWIIGTLSGSLVTTIALTAVALGKLSLFNLVASVLVAGLGLDYALFFSRTEKSAESLSNTRHAVTICFLSTCFAFAILAMSSVPILRSIGVTVAVGVCINFALARLGIRKNVS
jgi:predicted exporter